MAIIDYKTTEIADGLFDINIPLEKIVIKSDLLFQQVNLILNTYTGEFLYNILDGIDYDSILGQDIDLTSLEGKYYDKISLLVYFSDLQDFTINITDDRNIEISFNVVAEDQQSRNFIFSQGL